MFCNIFQKHKFKLLSLINLFFTLIHYPPSLQLGTWYLKAYFILFLQNVNSEDEIVSSIGKSPLNLKYMR